jgi:hypothetical protein
MFVREARIQPGASLSEYDFVAPELADFFRDKDRAIAAGGSKSNAVIAGYRTSRPSGGIAALGQNGGKEQGQHSAGADGGA